MAVAGGQRARLHAPRAQGAARHARLRAHPQRHPRASPNPHPITLARARARALTLTLILTLTLALTLTLTQPGRILNLAKGATLAEAAALLTDDKAEVDTGALGDQAQLPLVNGEQMPAGYEPNNGDLVSFERGAFTHDGELVAPQP